MLASKIACPNCHTGFKTKSSIRVGQKIKCPRCGADFSVPAQSSMLSRTPASSPRPSNDDTRGDMSLNQPRTHDDMNLSRSQPATQLQDKKRSKAGIVFLIGALLLLLVLGSSAAVILLSSRNHSDAGNAPDPQSGTEPVKLKVKVKINKDEMTTTDEKGNKLKFKRVE